MKKWTPLLLAAAALAVQPAAAQDHPAFKIILAAAQISPLGEEDVSIGSVRDSIKASSTLGWNVGFEWRATKTAGIEIDYIDARHDVEFGGQKIGEVGFSPLSATLNLHIIPLKVFDLYAGPTFSWVNWGDVKLDSGGSEGTESEFAWGATAGLDIGGERFAFTGAVRWLSLDLPGENVGDAGVDPLIARVGIAIKFF